jgi:15-cis-phytoene synthase
MAAGVAPDDTAPNDRAPNDRAPNDRALEQAVEHCVALTRQHSSTFYLGSRLFGPQERRAVSVVYAVCRTGDDAVDEVRTAEGRARLAAWWETVERAYAGSPRRDAPLEVGLAWVLERYPIEKGAFEELYLGLESDLGPQLIHSLEDLMLYCRRVAGVVGLMIAPVAGYDGGDDTLLDALALGQAMQLTNILRDVGEDLDRGRCYLPESHLERYGVALSDLRSGTISEGYVALLEDLAHLAHRLYRLGWRGIPNLHGAAKAAVGVAALNYEGILHKLRQNRYDNLTRRAFLRPHERLALIPRAMYSVYAGHL